MVSIIWLVLGVVGTWAVAFLAFVYPVGYGKWAYPVLMGLAAGVLTITSFWNHVIRETLWAVQVTHCVPGFGN